MTAGSPANGGTFTVTDGSAFPASNFYVVIDLEIILISSRSGNTFTVHASTGRGQRGTSAASHNASSQVFNGPLAHHVSESAYTTQTNVFTQYQHFDAATAAGARPTTGGAHIWGTNLGGAGVLVIQPQSKSNSGNVIHLDMESTATSGINAGLFADYDVAPAADTSAPFWNTTTTVVSGAANTTGDLVGLLGSVSYFATGTTTKLTGTWGSVAKQASSGAITHQRGVVSSNTNASGTTTNVYGYYGIEPTVSGGGAYTNAYGLFVEPIDIAGTLNVGARIDTATTAALWLGGDATSTTVAGGITFGSGRDVNIFRSAANTINITATGTPVLQVGGNTVAVLTAQTFTGAQVIDVGTDVVPLTLIGHSSQTAAYFNIRNDANTRTYFDLKPEFVHNQTGLYLQFWGTGTSSGLSSGLRADLTVDAAGASSTGYINFLQVSVPSANSQNYTADLAGAAGQVDYKGTGTHTTNAIIGVKGAIAGSNASAGLVTNAYAVLGHSNTASALTNYAGFFSKTPTGAGTVTNAYGAYVEPMTKGGTQSIGVRIDIPTGGGTKAGLWLGADGTTATQAAGIVFRSDQTINLYPASSTVLQTDDIFNAAAGVQDNGVLVTKQIAFTFTKAGTLTTATGTTRQYIDGGNWSIISARASVNTAPTGATILVDVNKNGTTVFTTQSNRPTIAISGNTALAAAINVSTLTTGDYLTVDIDQIGSTVAGADLTVTVWLQRA